MDPRFLLYDAAHIHYSHYDMDNFVLGMDNEEPYPTYPITSSVLDINFLIMAKTLENTFAE
jgi:hypothetical protein